MTESTHRMGVPNVDKREYKTALVSASSFDSLIVRVAMTASLLPLLLFVFIQAGNARSIHEINRLATTKFHSKERSHFFGGDISELLFTA